MVEAFTLFDSVCNSKWFGTTAMILFLNKIDILKEKLAKSNVKEYFKEYESDPLDFNKVSEFFKNQFLAKNKNTSKQVYTHFTCATDTTQKICYVSSE